MHAQAPAPQAKGKGGGAPRQLGMENGLTYFQTRCMSCHRENDSSKAPSARRIRQMTPEQIYAVVSKPSRPEHDQGLTDPQKRRMSEFMGGYRQIGSVEAGNPKNFPNACPSNPPMTDPYAGAVLERLGRGHREHALSEDRSRRHHQGRCAQAQAQMGVRISAGHQRV